MGSNWRPISEDVRGTARQLTEELRGIKDRSGLSLTQIGIRTHYSKASWERWFNGKRLITEHALESLAQSVDESARQLKPLLERAAREAEQDAPAAASGTTAAFAEDAPTELVEDEQQESSGRTGSARERLRQFGGRHGRTLAVALSSALLGGALGAWIASPSAQSAAQASGSRSPAASPVSVKTTPHPPCEGVGCAGKDPQSTGCVTDSKVLTTSHVGKVIIYLHYSPRCKAAWGALTDAAPRDTATIFTTSGDQQTALVHWGFDNYSMMVDASDPSVGLKVCGVQPKGSGCTSTLPVPAAG